MSRQAIVETAYGKLQGYFTGHCLLFAGIPYAAPPTGTRRFKPPECPAPWTGVRDATHFGPIQPQSPSRFTRFLGPDPQPQSEDSLFLNVWTPSADQGRRPVLVFIHGGAWVSGNGSLSLYHGVSFAERHGLVVVTLNYRLAEGGSLYLGHLDPDYTTSGNTALLDQIAALEWVRDNITMFGGDPGNVTISGQSAGANAVVALMAAPRAAGLFHRAISHSLARLTPLRSKAEAIEATELFFKFSGSKTIADLQKMSINTLLATRGQVMGAMPPTRVPWGAIMDEEVIPEQPLTAAAAGRLAPVPLLIGACHDDYRPYLSVLPADSVPQDEEAAVVRLLTLFGLDGARLVQGYRELLGSISPTEIFVEAMTDYRFRQPSIMIAERHAQYQPTFMFDFMWASPVQNGALGAGHTVDLPFAFHTLWTPSTPYHLGEDPPMVLADQMHEAWSTFARSGQPAAVTLPTWPPYAVNDRATMALDVQSALRLDPERTRRLYWAEGT